MEKVTIADRLNEIMDECQIKQVDILRACKPYCEKYGTRIERNDLSQYVSGKVTPRQDKLTILALALNVNEIWLMGYDVPKGRNALDHASQFCDQYNGCHNTDACTFISTFLRLDSDDRQTILTLADVLLKKGKYKEGTELCQPEIGSEY